MARRRRRGEGSTFFDATNGVWVARVSLGVRNGKRVGKKITAHTKRAADQERERLLRIYTQGGEPANGTLDEYLKAWLESHGPSVRPSTAVTYAGHVRKHISPLLGGIVVARLRPSDVRRLIADRLASGQSPASVQRIVTTLRIALGQAVRDRAIADNPASHVSPVIPWEHRALAPREAGAISHLEVALPGLGTTE